MKSKLSEKNIGKTEIEKLKPVVENGANNTQKNDIILSLPNNLQLNTKMCFTPTYLHGRAKHCM
jgi:hypothetical protein